MIDPEDFIPNWAFKRIDELAESNPHAGVHGVRQMAAHCDMWRRSFARYVVQQEAKHRETLDVLQTAHESEATLVAGREALRQHIWQLQELLARSLRYVTQCADEDRADAVACMMLIERELQPELAKEHTT